MPRLRDSISHKRFFKRNKKPRVKYITLLPSLITILNGLLGFIAIVFAGKGAEKGYGQFTYFAMAGYMICLPCLQICLMAGWPV